jgi:hypothetical protein
MVAAVLRRLHLLRRQPPVVLAGGVFRADDAPFLDRIREGLARPAPGARVVRLDAPPVLGAALLALDRVGRSDDACGGDHAGGLARAGREAAEAAIRAALEKAPPAAARA